MKTFRNAPCPKCAKPTDQNRESHKDERNEVVLSQWECAECGSKVPEVKGA